MRRVLFALIVALIVPSSTMASSVQVRNSAYGPVLFSGSGRALYLFTSDRTRRATCYGACARAWPPFYARGRATARAGARRGLLGTARRRGGRRQVTYAGHPLYFYAGDPVGQIRCQNVFEFGGTWLVVSARGRAVR
jgi:predicted lipoprotein with Yx(FWY)xxD motif